MEETPLTEYRSISGLAILTLLLGIASALAFIGPLLLVLPVVGLGVGLLALARLKAHASHLSGHSLARWGLLLSVLFGVGATVRPVLLRELLLRQGDAFSQHWLEMLTTGQIKQALRYVDSGTRIRLAPHDTQGKPIRDENIETNILQAFRDDSFVQALQTDELPVTIRFYQGVVLPPTGRDRRMSRLIYEIETQLPTADHRLQFVQLGLSKSGNSSGTDSVWSVMNWKIAPTLAALADAS